jgi:hypothetical protein
MSVRYTFDPGESSIGSGADALRNRFRVTGERVTNPDLLRKDDEVAHRASICGLLYPALTSARMSVDEH